MHRLVIGSMAGFFATLSLAVTAHPGGIERLDVDGDGQVSREEFQLPEEHRGPRPLQRADLDGDGVITREELLASIDSATRERSEEMRERFIALFDEIDEDGNSVVTLEEVENHAFARLDADGNGFVTEEEAQAVRERRRERVWQQRQANS